MKNEQIYLGVKGSVVALHKEDGCELWRTSLKGYSFVNLLIEDELIFAHTGGHLFCLDKNNGDILWENGLTGLGYGIATLSTESNTSQQVATAVNLMKEQAAASNSSAGTAGM